MTDQLNMPDLPRISDYLFYHADRHPDREFLVLDTQRLTYAEAADQVSALSRAFMDLGVRATDRIAVLSTPRPDFGIALLAAVDIGCIYVGLNPKYRAGELRHVVDDSQPKVLIGLTNDGGRDFESELRDLRAGDPDRVLVTMGGALPGASTLEDLIARGRPLDDAERIAARAAAGGREPALIVYTSGTTGAPKGAVLSHTSLTWSFGRQAERWAANPMRMICNMPINHSACVGDIVSTCLISGGTLVFMERFDVDAMLDLIADERISVLMQVPTMFQLLARHPRFGSSDLSSLRRLVWGGAAMPRAVLHAFERPGLAMEVMYGQTEAPASLTYSNPDASVEQLTQTIGMPDPEIDLRLATSDGQVCARGETGEIQVRHPSIFLGYFENAVATSDAFTPDGYLRTGDLAVERPDSYLQITGRLKEMFKSGGYNVYPREVELCLERHPEVMIAVVVEMPDRLYDEVGHAFVVLRRRASSGPAELIAWCQAHLANYKVPKAITIKEELPMLPIGKPDKQALRKQARATRLDAAPVTTPDA